MKTEEHYFKEGKTIQQYMDEMGNLKEESFHVYQEFQLPDDGFVNELAKHSLHFLVITEDWCGDAMMINPVIRKLGEAADIEVHVTLRDADTELIDRHLTNGGRAIPIVLILNDEGTLIGKWGPRAPEVQKIVDDLRAELPAKDDPSFPEKQKEMIASLQKRYKEENTLWLYVYQSFKKALLSCLN
ncbi:thioredoxin family protein [Metabacillus sp. YM-086]|uniref:thioredoxin family protein n=1 Tax=Metabacillus sp. YM-086 TaxID=3341729 RepID=UPI003A88F02F